MTSSSNLKRYVPNSSKAPYRELMNSVEVQRYLLRKADQVAAIVRAQDIECRTDVQPGQMRAHARATIDHQVVDSFKSRGHNLRIDRVLLAALQSIRRG